MGVRFAQTKPDMQEADLDGKPPEERDKRGLDDAPALQHSHDDDEDEDEDDDDDEERAHRAIQATPCYHFPAEFQLDCENSYIMGCAHECQRHPEGTRAIVLFFPGVHGGVGPCRQPGSHYDADALYPTLSRRLSEAYPINCYRCSWPYMRPQMAYAVGAACKVLDFALRAAIEDVPVPTEGQKRDVQVFLVGHSLGGAVVVQAAEVIARHFCSREDDTDDNMGAEGEGDATNGTTEKPRTKGNGAAGVNLRVAGICTLNGACDIRQLCRENDPASVFVGINKSRALFICGDADAVVPPEATHSMFQAMPMESKRQLVMPGGTHDLFDHKATLLEELESFITADMK